MIPTLGIITVFCGFSAIAARFGGGNGPMHGTWLLTVNNSEHDSAGSKPVKSKETLTVAITDNNSGPVSLISMQGISAGNEDLFLFGNRVGTAFFVQTAALGDGSELVTLSGTISKPGTDGQSKTFRGTGSSLGFDGGGGKFATGTSDSTSVDSLTLFKLSAKRVQVQ
ncbi:MAG: hypothetical protein ACKVS6_00770 [Planctomycetota bacterium]